MPDLVSPYVFFVVIIIFAIMGIISYFLMRASFRQADNLQKTETLGIGLLHFSGIFIFSILSLTVAAFAFYIFPGKIYSIFSALL